MQYVTQFYVANKLHQVLHSHRVLCHQHKLHACVVLHVQMTYPSLQGAGSPNLTLHNSESLSVSNSNAGQLKASADDQFFPLFRLFLVSHFLKTPNS
jgi:hypothetical protein